MEFSEVTQKDLDWLKSLFPEDKELQSITLDKYQEMAKDRKPDINNAQFEEVDTDQLSRAELTLTQCQLAVGVLSIDCVLVVAGAIGIHSKINPEAYEKAGEALAKFAPKIADMAAKIAERGASASTKAKTIFQIAKFIFTSGAIGAVCKAIIGSLKWYDKVLYGALFGATLLATLGTDGVALIAVIIGEMAQIGFVVVDAINVHRACG